MRGILLICIVLLIHLKKNFARKSRAGEAMNPKAKSYQKEYKKAYQKTDKYKAYMKEYQKAYYLRKKGGAV